MLNLLGLLGKKKRAFERVSSDATVYIFSGQALLGSATLVDVSSGGARLRSTNRRLLEAAEYILDPARATVATVRLSWKSEGQAGYQTLSSTNLRGFVSDPTLAHIRTFWLSIADRHGMIAPGGAFGRAR